MIIRDFEIVDRGDARITSATVVWEESAYREQEVSFEVRHGELHDAHEAGEPCTDAFLAACFPLAAVHGESRVRIEGQPCPMLVEGLRTVHAWVQNWGG